MRFLYTSRWARNAALGLLLGTLVWAWGLGDGFRQGYFRGIASLETGQVRVSTTGAGFQDYFQLRALIESIRGVKATSARLEFLGTVTNHRGESRSILIRGANTTQESLVTQFSSRTQSRGPEGGLWVPQSWLRDGFLRGQATLSISRMGDKGIPHEVPLAGLVNRSYPLDGKPYAVLDLEHTRSLLGADALVTSFAVKLDKGIDADKWIHENRSAFADLPVELRSGADLAWAAERRIESKAWPYWVFQRLLLAAVFASLALLEWYPPEYQTRPGHDSMIAIVGAGLALVMENLVFPLVQGLLTRSFLAGYPYLGTPQVPWGWGVDGVMGTAAALVIVLAIKAIRRRAQGGPDDVHAEDRRSLSSRYRH